MKIKDIKSLTPQEIVDELDKYIIGQLQAKKNVAIALRNRWRRMNAPEDMTAEIIPNNILMIGSTGVGKTEIARRLAKLADAPFVKVEASKFTEVGYVGRDVESIIRDLAEQAFSMVKQTKIEEVRSKALHAAYEQILDILVPPKPENPSPGQPIGFNTDDDSENREEEHLNLIKNKTREAFKEKLMANELDHKVIQIDVEAKGAIGNVGVMGGPIDDASMMKIEEMISGMMPSKNKKRKVTIQEAKKILTDSEAQKLIDIEEVKSEALWKAQNLGIVFIDEIDKIAGGSKGSSPDVSREGVQRDLLPIVEGSAVNTKYGIVNTDHVLFIAAGAFHFSKPSDLIPELQGRFPIRVELENLSKDDFLKILTQPKNALLKQYQAMLAAEGVELSFDKAAIEELADMCFEINAEMENIGARRLQTVMSCLMNDIMFQVPDQIKSGQKLQITASLVKEKLQGLVKNKDLSQYIL